MDWLRALCHPDPVMWCSSPLTVELDGQPWAVATTGQLLLAVRGPSAFPPVTTHRDALARLLSARYEPGGGLPPEPTDVQRLLAWAGPSPDALDIPIRPGWIGKACINRALFAFALAALPDELTHQPVAPWVAPWQEDRNPNHHLLYVPGLSDPAWLLILCPLAVGHRQARRAPRWPDTTTEVPA